jgi:hypothetical protein
MALAGVRIGATELTATNRMMKAIQARISSLKVGRPNFHSKSLGGYVSIRE